MTFFLLVPVLAVATFALTWVIRGFAVRHRLVDFPNDRSSHALPTPRGGGLAIVLVAICGWSFAVVAGALPVWDTVIFMCCAVLVAGIGFADDFGHMPAHWRMLVHLFSATVVTLYVGGVSTLNFGTVTVELGALGIIIGILFIAWVLNLYNFMDGIDGIAGVEAVTVSAGACFLLVMNGDSELALATAVVGAACAGFLLWNWPPAKIFMGDVGSGFLGFVFGALALYSHQMSILDIYVWMILLGVFIVDATMTLLRRLLRRQKIYEAHRTHAYQHAAIGHGSHSKVSVVVAAINLIWLFPVGTLVAVEALAPMHGLVAAYFPLFVIGFRYHAGLEIETDQQEAME
jgi:Fuc2NAc and GlcNAc transferase